MSTFCVLYVPNGQVVGSEKFAYKCTWLSRVRHFLDTQCDAGKPLALCGDLNIAPEARDVHDPEEWEDSVLFHPDMRQAFSALCDWGLVDTFRLHHAEGKLYSWWDYRQLAFPKNKGLRIDHILVTQSLARALHGCCYRPRGAQRQGSLRITHQLFAAFDDCISDKDSVNNCAR